MDANDPVGPENADHVRRAVAQAEGPVVCAWGVLGGHMDQDRAMLRWLSEVGVGPLALALTKDEFPKHPLYVKYEADLLPYSGRKP